MHAHLRLGTLLALLLSACDASVDVDAGQRADAGDAAVVPPDDQGRARSATRPAASAAEPSGAVVRSTAAAPPALNERPASITEPSALVEMEPSIAALDPAAVDEEEPTVPEGFAFAFTHDRTYVVLATRSLDGWGNGPLTLVSRQGPTVIVRAVDRALLPREASALLERRFVLREGAEARCTAALGEPMLLRRVDAHFGQLARWNGEEGAPPVSDAVVAEEGWGLAPDAQLLVAEARAVTGRCAGAHWAHPADAQPDLGAAAQIPASRVVAAFRRLEDHQDLQSAWADAREYDDHPGFAHWDARPGAFRRIVRFRSREGRRFALISARAHDGCGDFTGGLYALFEAGSRGALTQVTSGYAYDDLPRALVDVDGDGVPEILFGSRIARPDGDSIDITTPYLDCPC